MFEHRVAKLAACAAFLLLVIGGMVNATGSSLACPEAWFICKKSMLPDMTGGVLYEHGHRLFAMTVGVLQIVLTTYLAIKRPDLRRLGFVLMGWVILQGVFGATTVHYKLLWYVSTTHLLFGMSYFAMLVYTVFRTRPAPSALDLDRTETLRATLGTARTWIAVACAAVFVQLLLGALVRHLGATLTCIGMPQCTPTGDWFPEDWLQRLHMIHRGFGIVVAIVTTIAAVKVWRRSAASPQLRMLVTLAPLLVAAQVGLGVATVLTLRAVPVAVGHFAGAASLWALWMYAWLLTGRRQKLVAVEDLFA
jgi:cytochrome c oxidase assembly protein subunit 15